MKPVTLPPGRARLATKPVPTGSPAAAKTMRMTDVACLAATTAAVADVTMTSTLRRTNSAAISAARSVRPSAQRYSIATVRPSIQPSSRSRWTKAATHWPATRNPMDGSFAVCCALAASGHAAAPPMNAMKSRRGSASGRASVRSSLCSGSAATGSRRRPNNAWLIAGQRDAYGCVGRQRRDLRAIPNRCSGIFAR